MDHPASGVRVLAAAHSLPDVPAAAIAVLEALQTGTGLHAIAAEHALTEYRAGRWSCSASRCLREPRTSVP